MAQLSPPEQIRQQLLVSRSIDLLEGKSKDTVLLESLEQYIQQIKRHQSESYKEILRTAEQLVELLESLEESDSESEEESKHQD